ncbi:MAG: hypothetical protein ACRELE_01780 [Gemmatimonadales bacterium]
MRRAMVTAAPFVLTLLAGNGCAHAQQSTKPQKPLPAPGLLLAPLAGQPIAVLPVSYVVSDGARPAGLPATRAAQLLWADSIVAEGLQARGPEASWILPPELRRVARRAPGMVVDPDKMGQSVMRYENLRRVPDPFLSSIRALVAMTGSRFVLIPAALRFSEIGDSVRVEATLVLADARSGAIAWRSTPIATATTAGAALTATIARILPDPR